MAKQSGINPMRGTIGNLTHRHTQDGDIVQRKTSIDADRFWNDPAFEASRGASHEFGVAGKAASLLARIFHQGIDKCKDNRVQGRLTKKLRKIINSDAVSKHGERNLLMGDVIQLKDFWWNKKVQISNIMGAPYNVTVDRTAGKVRFSIPSFIPDEALQKHPTATHFQIIASTAEVDWRDNGKKAAIAKTDFLKKEIPTEAFTGVLPVTKESTLPIVSCLAIRWFQRIAGEMEELFDMDYNTAGIVDVNMG